MKKLRRKRILIYVFHRTRIHLQDSMPDNIKQATENRLKLVITCYISPSEKMGEICLLVINVHNIRL